MSDLQNKGLILLKQYWVLLEAELLGRVGHIPHLGLQHRFLDVTYGYLVSM